MTAIVNIVQVPVSHDMISVLFSYLVDRSQRDNKAV